MRGATVARHKKTEDAPLDLTTLSQGDIVTAHVYPCRTRYNKPVLIMGRVVDIFESGLTLTAFGGYHSVRFRDIVKIKSGVSA